MIHGKDAMRAIGLMNLGEFFWAPLFCIGV
jgi:hypothetical protein